MMSLFGFLMPLFRTGKAFRTDGLCFAAHERNRHQEETSRNWTIVSVTGLGNAVKIAFDDAFERIDAENQIPHSILREHQQNSFVAKCFDIHTISL